MIDIAQRIADEVLAPMAEQVDQTTIPTSHLTALADAGLFSLEALHPVESRRVIAAIAGGCGATFFVWVQHHGVLRTLGQSDNEALRAELLEPLRSGKRLAGTAFAHVRRVGRPAVTATRVDGGWRLDGTAPWATSWGLADRFCVAAESSDGELVWAMLPGDGGDGVTATPLHLPVFASTGTVALQFDHCVIADADIVLIEDLAVWRAGDRRRASVGQPAILGVAERAVRLLREGAKPGDDDSIHAADRLAAEIASLWQTDEALVARLVEPGLDPGLERRLERDLEPGLERHLDPGLDDGDRMSDSGSKSESDQTSGGDFGIIGLASDHRARCLEIGERSTRALLAATGGQSMDLTHPAQRLMREAGFYVIQAQTSDGRSATLRAI